MFVFTKTLFSAFLVRISFFRNKLELKLFRILKFYFGKLFRIIYLFRNKIAYYFQKCCFDSEKIDVINECDRMSRIFNRKHEFEKYCHKGNGETFYCLNTKQLGEYWHCVIEDQRIFCPEKCDECEVL